MEQDILGMLEGKSFTRPRQSALPTAFWTMPNGTNIHCQNLSREDYHQAMLQHLWKAGGGQYLNDSLWREGSLGILPIALRWQAGFLQTIKYIVSLSQAPSWEARPAHPVDLLQAEHKFWGLAASDRECHCHSTSVSPGDGIRMCNTLHLLLFCVDA